MDKDELISACRRSGGIFLHVANFDGVLSDMAKSNMADWSQQISDHMVGELLRDGPSWRERLTALTLASMRGFRGHFDSAIQGFHNSGGMSIVPLAAAISVAIRDGDCRYTPKMTHSIDRSHRSGEFGFAIDWLHFTIGNGKRPGETKGPDFGQDFEDYVRFYVAVTDGLFDEPYVPAAIKRISICAACNGSGRCFCIRKGSGQPAGCPRCSGSAACRHCKGTGNRN